MRKKKGFIFKVSFLIFYFKRKQVGKCMSIRDTPIIHASHVKKEKTVVKLLATGPLAVGACSYLGWLDKLLYHCKHIYKYIYIYTYIRDHSPYTTRKNAFSDGFG